MKIIIKKFTVVEEEIEFPDTPYSIRNAQYAKAIGESISPRIDEQNIVINKALKQR